MFETDMIESRTRRWTSDMTAASVPAFLAYLYFRDLEEPLKESKICFELLAKFFFPMFAIALDTVPIKCANFPVHKFMNRNFLAR